MIKPGWKTTEFWVTVVYGLIVAAVSSGILGPETDPWPKFLGLVAGGLLASGYVIGRSIIKK